MNPNPDTGQSPETSREPIFLLPGSVAGLALLMLAIHAAYELALDADGQIMLLIWFGFLPVRFTEGGLPGGMLPLLWTPITHAFLHGSWTHVLLNVAWLAIFGTPVARRYGGVFMGIVFLTGAITGALFYVIWQWNDPHILIGASGGVAGLTGAAMRFIFQPVQMARHPETGEVRLLGRKLASLSEMWSNSRTRTFTLFWVGINLAIPIYDLFAGTQSSQIAWQAHIGGFIIGLILPSMFENRLKSQRLE